MKLVIILSIFFFAADACAASVMATVKDDAGSPVKNAVVYAISANGNSVLQKHPPEAVMDQQNKEFIPYVLPVQTGTPVYFPNKDNIRHHVYSISQPKKFELPLYKGTPAKPVIFDKPGLVVLGCNIHDWMLAYIYVLDTPFFAKTTESGAAEISDLPAGSYVIKVWHPLMKTPLENAERRLTVSQGEEVAVEFKIYLKPDVRVRRMPFPGGESYR